MTSCSLHAVICVVSGGDTGSELRKDVGGPEVSGCGCGCGWRQKRQLARARVNHLLRKVMGRAGVHDYMAASAWDVIIRVHVCVCKKVRVCCVCLCVPGMSAW